MYSSKLSMESSVGSEGSLSEAKKKPDFEELNKIWCEYAKKPVKNINKTVNYFLYCKYSSSQNYYFTKDVNDIISEARTPATFMAKDVHTWDHVFGV